MEKLVSNNKKTFFLLPNNFSSFRFYHLKYARTIFFSGEVNWMSCLNRADKACGRSERCEENDGNEKRDWMKNNFQLKNFLNRSGRNCFQFSFREWKIWSRKSAFKAFRKPPSSYLFPSHSLPISARVHSSEKLHFKIRTCRDIRSMKIAWSEMQ